MENTVEDDLAILTIEDDDDREIQVERIPSNPQDCDVGKSFAFHNSSNHDISGNFSISTSIPNNISSDSFIASSLNDGALVMYDVTMTTVVEETRTDIPDDPKRPRVTTSTPSVSNFDSNGVPKNISADPSQRVSRTQ
ncbi:hypothetical protein V6N13_000703 [Hibiscus sabdariffa]